MRKLIFLLTICLLFVTSYGAWDNDKPGDNQLWNNAAGSIRDNNDALEVELGIDLNEAHPYFQADEPDKKPDTTTALDSDDLGRLWVDSDDNLIYVLTNATGPVWTAQAAGSTITASDVTLTLTNTDEENSDGGRQSKYISKGEQDGGEVTTLGLIEFSHDGTSDDEKGQFKIFLNAGSDGNSPANQSIGYTADGKIDVGNSLSVLDEDDMSADSDKQVPTQQSVKAYVDEKHQFAQNSTTSTITGTNNNALNSAFVISDGTAVVDVTLTGIESGDVIEVKGFLVVGSSNADIPQGALFVDSVSASIAVGANDSDNTENGNCSISLLSYFTATGTSHTFKLRVSSKGGTYTVNNAFGGTAKSIISAKKVGI